jgi:hypothetical protein
MCRVEVFLFSEPESQYSHIVELVRTGNSTEAGNNTEENAADCAPCADSNSTLKEQIEKLDNMELIKGKEGACDKTDDDKSID